MPPQVGATPPPTRADRLAINLLEPAATPGGIPQASVNAEVMGTIHPQSAPRNGVNMFAHTSRSG